MKQPNNEIFYKGYREAARACGVSHSVIVKARKDGLITEHSKDEKGRLLFDPQVIHSRFPLVRKERKVERSTLHKNTENNNLKQAETGKELALNEQKIDHLEKELRLQRETIAELRTERNDWKDQAQRLLLSAPPKEVKSFMYHIKAAFFRK